MIDTQQKIQLTILIDTQQQYIKLNIRGEISIIVVQAHSGRKRDICTYTLCSSESIPCVQWEVTHCAYLKTCMMMPWGDLSLLDTLYSF
jgi:hypothetical protein